MDSFLIRGGNRLKGKVEISGSKNSALPILAACLLAEGKTVLKSVPRLSDIDSMVKLLGELGVHVYRHEPTEPPQGAMPPLNGNLDIEVRDERISEARYDIVKTMRASICVLGPLLAKRGRAVVSIPGGCAIGDRPVDLHVRGLQKLGAEFRTEGGNIVGTVPGGRLRGCRMYLGGAMGPTVLGTINVMCAAALAEGETVLVGAACEPEVVDCADLLIKMGAKIKGHGTPEIRIEGVEKLTGAEHRIIPDRIECGTFMMAAAITNGELELKHCNLDHLIAVQDRLDEVGVKITRENGTIFVASSRRLTPIEMTTQPFPGFPTDLQAQLMALLCLSDGMSVITERIFPDRFLHVGELNRMGGRIRKEGPTAIIQGVKEFQGAAVMCSDLRASAALVLAGLASRGEARLDRVYHIDRGYEKIEQKLKAVGADIERVSER
ncbi:UDP-N-acetylglucosamine 1-carboxyvinyltransferase [Humisphaera borealis]|uniref:UDP-N-acetylglucosamine 1-carboxyvinyltransferase n=1 Tax=Humisphaera borealis TaxID=2807512 RepID=A0A7M2WZ04_9BACT|nr:UDP-N-acetylglucosamine 1-carboxyvinyltransferase [Humisphaera borealis]QOV90757.1 UDP-N-acetylglucosamine 1-carboxyvinyltransferase [Humisphaera borealis]